MSDCLIYMDAPKRTHDDAPGVVVADMRISYGEIYAEALARLAETTLPGEPPAAAYLRVAAHAAALFAWASTVAEERLGVSGAMIADIQRDAGMRATRYAYQHLEGGTPA